MTSVAELMNLTGRVALVTGATGAIGQVISHTLAELGADLLLVDRPGTNIHDLSRTLQDAWSIKTDSLHCDLEHQDQREQMLRRVKQSYTKLNVLVNNAALVGSADLQGWVGPFEQQTVVTWRRALEVNLTAAFDLCKELAPLLRSAQGASIINIASIYGELGPDWSLYEGTDMGSPAAYAASKGGLLQLTRWLATTMAPTVRVNAISPGGVSRHQPETFVKRYRARTPLGRMATEDDFRGAITYLASDLGGYVTGQNLMVDGGWSIW